MIRGVVEITRRLTLVVVVGLTLLFLTGGLSQLYVEWQTFNQGDLDGLVPSVAEVRAAWDIHHETLREQHIPSTLWVALTGLSIGIGVGLLLAAIMDLVPLLRWVLYPLLVISQTIPIFAIAVLLILVFGFGFGPKIVVVALFSFFPVTVNTLGGLQSTDLLYTKLLRSMGANPLQTWWKVRLPNAMPSFFSGVRIAATYSVVGAVIGEYVGSGAGLGKFLQRSYQSFKTDQVFLAVAIIAILSVLLVILATLIEILALRWRYIGRRFLPMKFWPLLLVIVLVAFPLSALAQDGGDRPDPLGGATEFPRLDNRTAVTLMLDWTPNTNHMGFYAAQALGYYDEANLDVTIIEPSDLLVEQALDAEIVEFGIGFQEFSTAAMLDGAEIVSVAAIIQNNTSGFVTIADDHSLTRPADLAPLTYGGFGFTNLENAILRQLLACDGATWNEANYLDIGFADAIELMKRNRIDSAWIFYGWQGINAEVSGLNLDVVMLQDYADCIPNYYTPILLTSQAMLDEQPEVVTAFVQATARGYAYAIQYPDKAADILLNAVPELDSELVKTSAEWLSTQYQADAPRWGQQDPIVWQGFTDFLYENGIISEAFDTNAVFTNDFLPGTVED